MADTMRGSELSPPIITRRADVRTLCLIVLASIPLVTLAQESGDAFHHWPIDLKINGKIIIGDQLQDTAAIGDVLSKDDQTGKVALLVDDDIDPQELISYASLFRDATDYRVVKRDPSLGFGEIEMLLNECSTFLWRSTRPLSRDDSQSLRRHRGRFDDFSSGGGTLLGIGPAADFLGEIVVAAGDQPPPKNDSANDSVEASLSESPAFPTPVYGGLGLLPDCLVQFGDGDRICNDMKRRLTSQPRAVGVVLNRGALLRLSGRVMSLAGQGTATFVIASGSQTTQSHSQTIAQRQSRRQSANDYLIDLTQWRRRAIDQTLDVFPPADPDPPHVSGGTLIIVGGGGMPSGLMDRFVEMAGGLDQARLVYVPCSEQAEIRGEPSTIRQWKKMGVRHATFLHTKDRNRANSDETFLAPLKDATGIWLGGGRQWNFADSYYGTRAQRLMQDVVKRGGVAGGSSAGASVQARFLARATPIENFRILAPGYERGGIGFISGVAIDQHFTQRSRQPDMTRLVKRYPQLLGIGIDESTALIVNESVAEIVGNGDVYFYDRSQAIPGEGPDYVKLAAGGRYDLAKRELIEEPTP
jgi:cyanophycinase